MDSPLSRSTPVRRAARAVVRRLASLLAALLMAVPLAPCWADSSIAPSDVATRAEIARQTRHLDAFVLAQATQCERSIPGDCAGIGEYDLGKIDQCYPGDACATGLGKGVGSGGVNARWWARKGLPPFPRFKYLAKVTDTPLPDGRRRVTARVQARNTFIAVLGLSDFSVPVVANFTEYPSIVAPGEPSALAVLGESSIDVEMSLPVGFIGLPDLIQWSCYDSDIEVTRPIMTSSVKRPLRETYDGISEGTWVKLDGYFYIVVEPNEPAHEKREHQKHHGCGPGMNGVKRITVKVLGDR